MKTILFLMMIVLGATTIIAQEKSEKSPNIYINAITADQNYYDKAILNYKILNHVISRFGTIDQVLPKEKPLLSLLLKNKMDSISVKSYKDSINKEILKREFCIKNGVPTMKLFDVDGKDNIRDEQIRKLRQVGVEKCFFQFPLMVKDLTSGFQFRHYVFDQDNTAAIKAFGINSTLGAKAKYIIIDYLQYTDNNCPGLPKIRHAIGIRAEITFYNFSSKSNINISSLPAIAADAQINNKHVNISIKTIGITGLGAKFNIPNNTSFNVDTYADYQKIIDFIRTFKGDTPDNINRNTNLNGNLIKHDSTILFKPQLIPVMDEYRVTDVITDDNSLDFIQSFEKKLKKVERKMIRSSKKSDSMLYAYYGQEKEFIEKQYKEYLENRRTLNTVQHHNDTEQYSLILKLLYPTTIDSAQIKTLSEELQQIPLLDQIERDAYIALLNKDIQIAKNKFEDLEKMSPKYKSAYEISKYLDSLPSNLKNQDWDKIYQDVTKDYLWKAPNDIKQEFKERVSSRNKSTLQTINNIPQKQIIKQDPKKSKYKSTTKR
ncbi:hypothetical protein BBI01_07165 [Chryseobacterium artocarpi]|uniref:Uncharacterized protein n=1 Tax=Chryseobacterium artocarpi TaxID=1414727 RepID=A0A1B8ZK27_9FLAO|nr:hypothetical protein [Chryseobacterium artocarpi]OCA71930.1 hypothetical protein BBI01_07165 [Chryseobacterium artocarpi]